MNHVVPAAELDAKVAERVRDPKYGAEMLRVEWAADLQNPVIEVTTQVRAANRSVQPGRGTAPPLSDEERSRNLGATSLLPVDGIVKGLKVPDWPTDSWQALHRLALRFARMCTAR